ncbi:uncharacterized protein Dwil_GK22390 [Drosophila willistoni]|uniref:Trimethylguanosine synthase n=1 Tax=Drosophila willistoni TaxID=7260 RepID=B4NG87_DROWI|nr:trimethylguanosine synthase [Drosophila willistoni]EDW83304.2 uncharacterized protein Dwil_GK22390 [Drosophila willistoni]
MNLHYLTTSRTNPQFYTFRQNFVKGQNLELDDIKWEEIQNLGWLDFWHGEGHQLLEKKWHTLYPTFQEEIDVATSEERANWQELWEEHSTTVSGQFWHIFSCAFENYQLRFIHSLESDNDDERIEDVGQTFENLELENIETEIEEENNHPTDDFTSDVDVDEEHQLKLMGLPTAFGTQRQQKARQETLQDIDSETSSIIMPNENKFLHRTRKDKWLKAKELKKKIRDISNIPQFMQDENPLKKYWFKRFSLFSRFDQGIRLDRESWFSVTPERIAKQTANRLACDLIVDAFCGCGGNAIQFALTCQRVIAIDIDAQKLAMAKHNAKIYNVDHKIEFIHADFLQFAKSTLLKPNMVFLSPPWGGPEYLKHANFDIELNLLPVGATELMNCARQLSSNVGFFLPRNANMKQVIALTGAAGQQCEVEHNFLDTRMVAITAYYGKDLIKGDRNDDDNEEDKVGS